MACHRVQALKSYLGSAKFESSITPAILNEMFGSFLQSLQINSDIMSSYLLDLLDVIVVLEYIFVLYNCI
jgi:hypothetical protein